MAHKRELAMRSTHSRIHIHIFLRAGSVVVVVKKVAKLPKARKKTLQIDLEGWQPPARAQGAGAGGGAPARGPGARRRPLSAMGPDGMAPVGSSSGSEAQAAAAAAADI